MPGSSAQPRGRHNSWLGRVSLSMMDAVMLGGFFAKWSYRWGFHGRLSVTMHDIEVTARNLLPRPLVLAFASDFHAGPTTYQGLFEDLLTQLRRQQPDALLLGGDYVSSDARTVDLFCTYVRQYRPPLGTFGVLGNHDLWTDDVYVARQLTAAGVQMLVNQNVTLAAPFDSVSICGIDDPWTGTADVAKTFRGAAPIRIFLSHSPEGVLYLQKERFDLGLAGHTHGGQVARRDGSVIISAGGPLSRSHSRGRFDMADHGPLIVSRGVGCSNLPIRINSDPELIICRLH